MNWRWVILIVLVVCIIVWIYRNTDDRRRRAYRRAYARSHGSLDNHAVDALRLVRAIEEPDNLDNYLAGRLIELNVAQGLPNRQQRDEIVDRYTRVLGLINEAETRPRAYRRVAFVGDDLHHPRAQVAFAVHPMVMIDHIQNFAENIGFDGEIEDALVWNMRDLARDARTAVVKKTRDEVVAESKTKKEFAANFAEANVTHTNDPQNVHDPSVSIGNRTTMERIRQSVTNKSIDDVFDEVYAHAKSMKGEISDDKLRRLRLVLDKMRRGTLVFTYGEREPDILKFVWDRAHDRRNKHNHMLMKDALVTGLIECMPATAVTPVCSVGRASAAIGSLITLDYDKDVGVALTEEQYCNEIRSSAVHVLNKLIDEEKKSSSNEMRKVAESYDDPNIQVDPEFEQLFKQKLKNRIDALVDSYADKLTELKLENVRAECYIAVVVE